MKSGKLFTLIITVLFASINTGNAQDMHFSQFYVSNLTLNPATTGVMSCQMRVSAIYRNQWASVAGKYAFNTFGLGVEGKFNVGKKDYVGLGLSVWVDRAGASAMTSVQAAISGSYLKKIGGRRANEHYLVAGAQIGFTQRSIRLDQLRWGTNWDGSAFNPALPDNEDVFNKSLAVADLSAGLHCALGILTALEQNRSLLNLLFMVGQRHGWQKSLLWFLTLPSLYKDLPLS